VTAVSEHLLDRVRGQELDLAVLAGAVDHDLRGAELAAPVDDRHRQPEAGEEERLLERGVAAADHDDVLFLEERAVAGRASRHAAALEALLGVDAEPARAGPGRDDHRVRAVLVLVDPHPEGPLREVDPGDVVVDELRAEALGLAAEVGHHLGPGNAVRVARVVLDVARDHQLAAPLEPFDHEGLELGAGSVECRRVTGGPASDDDHFTYVVRGAQSILLQQVFPY